MSSDATRSVCRREVAVRGLTRAAASHLTQDALGRIDFDKLAPVKALVKRFFSAEGWSGADDDALAALVGGGQGWWRYGLDDSLELEFGWREGVFRLDVVPSFGFTFDGAVFPEVTPNPRTIRFVTGPIQEGPSRWYDSADAVDDPRVLRVFEATDAVANVLVGPDFVAVGLHRPDDWPAALAPVILAVETEFASSPLRSRSTEDTGRALPPRTTRPREARHAPNTTLERAWAELGRLRPDRPDDLRELVAALSSAEAPYRQVAARLLTEADPAVAAAAWTKLLDDPSRSVRRATVDAMVDAHRTDLRAVLERALTDPDAWIRWKSLHGLVELGIEPSRHAVTDLTQDTDFRVRLEATAALQS
jgi:hypothetical protein